MRVKRWPALRWGGILGGAGVVLAAAHEALASGFMSLAATLLAGVAFFLACLVLFFAAGALAARETRLVRSGTLAGLFAALIAGVASILFAIVHTVLQRSTGVSPLRYTLELVTGASGIFLAVLILFLVFGAAFGALGGVAGRPVVAATPGGAPYPPAIPPVAYPGAAGSTPVFAAPLDAPTVEVTPHVDAEPPVHAGATLDGEAVTEREER